MHTAVFTVSMQWDWIYAEYYKWGQFYFLLPAWSQSQSVHFLFSCFSLWCEHWVNLFSQRDSILHRSTNNNWHVLSACPLYLVMSRCHILCSSTTMSTQSRCCVILFVELVFGSPHFLTHLTFNEPFLCEFWSRVTAAPLPYAELDYGVHHQSTGGSSV